MPLRLKGDAPKAGGTDRRYYMIDVQVEGRRERLSSGTRDKALALRREQAVVDAIRANPTIPKQDLLAFVRGDQRAATLARRTAATGPTFGELGEEMKEHVWRGTAAEKKTTSCYEQVLKVVPPDTPISEIDRAFLEAVVTRLKSLKPPNSNPTINRKLSVISCVLDRALNVRKCIHFKPHMPRQAGDGRVRQYVFDEGQFDAMMDAVRARDERFVEGIKGAPVKQDAEHYVLFFYILYETGMRPAEALSLPWRNINMERREIMVKHAPHLGIRTKTGKSRVIPMTDRCHELLLGAWGKTKGGPFQNLSHRRANAHWLGARRALKITDKDCVPYATRHSLATRVIEATGDLHLAKEWLGHSTIALTSNTYGHVATPYLTRGAGALNTRRQNAEESSITKDSVILETEQTDAPIRPKAN